MGAINRVADQSLLTAAVVVWDRPAIGAASAISVASTALGRPIFGVSWAVACAPQPTIVTADESGRDRCRAATAVAAAVRMIVIVVHVHRAATDSGSTS